MESKVISDGSHRGRGSETAVQLLPATNQRMCPGHLRLPEDIAGDSEDLYEALEWMDRRWDVSDHTVLLGRVIANYCGQRVAQWHRLCVMGD